MMQTAEEVRLRLKEMGYACSLINSRFVKPIDREILKRLAENHKLFVTIEEGVLMGGYGEQAADCVMEEELHVKVIKNGIPDIYVEHGNVDLLRKEVRLDVESIVEKTVAAYAKIK